MKRLDATKRLAAALALLLVRVAVAAPAPLLAPGGALPVSLDNPQLLFKQCSRAAPPPTGQVWKPTPEQIARLEQALPAFIEQRRARHQPAPPAPQSYDRQYFGFTRGGQSFVYGNFFPAGNPDHGRRPDSPVIVCDGGPAFWGIVYDLGAGRFEEPQFNGPP